MTRPIRTAVIGAGLAATVFHVPLTLSLPELFTLHSVVERTPPEPEGTVAKKFGVKVNLKTKIEDVLADPDVELVRLWTNL
jgi:predicted dehydrogenase